MSAEIERTVPQTALVFVNPDSRPHSAKSAETAAQRTARATRAAEHAARSKAIAEAGGAEAWIQRELASKGLLESADPSTLEGKEKAAYKERKKAEAKERRALAKLVWEAHRATHLVHLGSGIYFHDEDDERKEEREARELRAKQNDLIGLDTVGALVEALGLTIPKMRWLAFHRDVTESSHYQIWTIPKRDGSRRTISAPLPELKRVQRWLLRNVFEKLPVHHAAHGFLAGRSIVTNGTVHAAADVIVKVDIKDFFPTIGFRRVKGLLRRKGLAESVATVCALLVTEPPREIVHFRGKTLYVAKGSRALPQGAPTSPAITNALCVRMDRRMSGLARHFGFVYTRYADDLTFSYREGPGSASATQGSRAPVGALLHGIEQILRSEGFLLHKRKTAVMRSGARQQVTGLVVNGASGAVAARVPREVVRRLKAAIWNREHGKPGREGETLEQLKGLAAFVHMSDPDRGKEFLRRLEALAQRTEPAPS